MNSHCWSAKYCLLIIAFIWLLVTSVVQARFNVNHQLLRGLEQNIGLSAKEQILELHGGSYELALDEHLFLQEIFNRLVTVADREIDYNLTVLNTPQLNAFALPGGHIFITRGLQQFLGRDVQRIAAVLAHEIAHVELKHGMNSMLRQLGFTVLVEFALYYLELSPSQAVRAASLALVNAVQSGYSREAELEADLLGQQYLVLAGFDPAGMITMLSNVLDLTDGEEQLDLFSTHPPTTERMARLTEQLLDCWTVSPLTEPLIVQHTDPGLDPLGRFVLQEQLTEEGQWQLRGFDHQRALDLHWLVNEEARYPMWSADGSRLAVLVKQQNTWDIWLLNRLGRVVNKLACQFPNQPWNLFFSPDGSMIAYNYLSDSDEPHILVHYINGNFNLNFSNVISGLILDWDAEGLIVWDDGRQQHYLIQPPPIQPLFIANPIPRVIQRKPRATPIVGENGDSGFSIIRPNFFSFD